MTFNIETVGVIGAGQMGAGIAEVAAQAGMTVSLTDVAEERVNAALATINGHLSRQVAKGQIVLRTNVRKLVYAQVESDVPDMIRGAGMRILTDQFVRQGFYPSRVLVARNGR